jgi:DNA-directed RNA polymerase specialized sigma24 family protein
MEPFGAFAARTTARLRRALVAAYGPDAGAEGAAEAMAYGWEHWRRIGGMENPAGYLYRVGQTAARRHLRAGPPLPEPSAHELPDVEPRLIGLLNDLSEAQRTCVLLVHGYGWSQQEVADLLDVSHSTVRTHLARGLSHLRTALEVDHAP